jgi:hypothetical protein
MTSSTTTRPVNLTDPAVLDAAARAWIASNGVPNLNLVQDAIAFSNAHGDPLCDNPFRRALVRVAVAEHGAEA